MKQIIGILLIIGSLALGYDGIHKLQNSSASVKILGVELNAEDSGGKQTAVVELGLAVIALLGGVYLLRSAKS
jgi:hypothetical protein